MHVKTFMLRMTGRHAVIKKMKCNDDKARYAVPLTLYNSRLDVAIIFFQCSQDEY